MNSRLEIQDELKLLQSSLPANEVNMPYAVPDGYFDALPKALLLKVKTETIISAQEEIDLASPLLSGISRKSPYSVPENYFETSISALPAFTTEDQLTVLKNINKGMPYSVPSGYFEHLPAQLLRHLQPKAKVVSMRVHNWSRLMAVAVVAALISVTGILYFSPRQEMAIDNPQWVAKKLKNISDRELEEFVKTTDVNQQSTATAKTSAKRLSDVKKLLQDVPDTELNAFLEQVPSDDDEPSLN